MQLRLIDDGRGRHRGNSKIPPRLYHTFALTLLSLHQLIHFFGATMLQLLLPRSICRPKTLRTVNTRFPSIRSWAKKNLLRYDRAIGLNRLISYNSVREKLSGKQRPFQVLKHPTKTGFNVIELFAGAGGLALGLDHAGLQTELLVENNRDACNTLRENWLDKELLESDVRDVNFSDYHGQVDVVSGGFPCQAFSDFGNRGVFEDTRGTLFFEFARCVRDVQPKIFMGENVRGLLSHDKGRTLEVILTTLRDLGYEVEVKLLRAHFLDVAQKRERVFIIGVRDDVDTKPTFPEEHHYTISVREALRGVPESVGRKYQESAVQVNHTQSVMTSTDFTGESSGHFCCG